MDQEVRTVTADDRELERRRERDNAPPIAAASRSAP